jgi:hypothetical protein
MTEYSLSERLVFFLTMEREENWEICGPGNDQFYKIYIHDTTRLKSNEAGKSPSLLPKP